MENQPHVRLEAQGMGNTNFSVGVHLTVKNKKIILLLVQKSFSTPAQMLQQLLNSTNLNVSR